MTMEKTMDLSNCRWCGKQLDARNGDECYQCFVTRLEVERNPEIASKVLAQLAAAQPAQADDDWLNEPMCSSCGHSESRHKTAGGFCKHCTCNEFRP